MTTDETSAYIDYESFLDPSFSPASFANTLVVATNDPSDTPLDLNTPLSRVLFDIQEVDTHIDTITSKTALPLLSHTQANVTSSSRILEQLESQLAILTESHERLEKEVLSRYNTAEETRIAADRIWDTVRLGRAISRCLTIGRQLDLQTAELRKSHGSARREDHSAMIRASNTLLLLRQALTAEGDILGRIHVIGSMRLELVDAAERLLVARADQLIKQFSISGLLSGDDSSEPTFAQSEDIRARTTASLLALFLLSPVKKKEDASGVFEPTRLVIALEEYIRRAITASLAGLSAALAALPKLERTLQEISARCQNIVALECLLDSIKAPVHPHLIPETMQDEVAPASYPPADGVESLLKPLLDHLDTASLPSYYWRTMASQLSARVQKIIRDGGVSARTLRTNRDRVRDSLRACVDRGSQIPPAMARSKHRPRNSGSWEREATVMIQAVVSVLGK